MGIATSWSRIVGACLSPSPEHSDGQLPELDGRRGFGTLLKHGHEPLLEMQQAEAPNGQAAVA